MDFSDKKRTHRLICLALGLVTLGVYSQVIGFDFLNFDDGDYVTENSAVKAGLTLRGFIWAFTHCYASNWHPLTWISHMVDCQIFGLWAGGHHLVNVLFHVANTILLFLLLERLTEARWASAVVAALFALHPMHIESVAWVSERKDVLSTFFGLLSLLVYVNWVQRKRARDKLLALVLFALGLLAKPMLVTLPCLMLLLDVWPLRRVENEGLRTFISPAYLRLIREKWLWLVLAAGSCLATVYAQKTGGTVLGTAEFPFFWRLINAVGSYWRYTQKIFWPIDLAAYYPLEKTQSIWIFLAAAAFLIFVSAGALATFRRRPWFLVGWLWFFGTLVPVIGVMQVGNQEMADRYSYVPAIGLFIVVVWAGKELAQFSKKWAVSLTVAAITIVLVLTAITSVQVRYWRNSLTLFGHVLAVTRDNALAHNNLGAALAINGRKPEALAHYLEAVRLDPGKLLFQFNLATALAYSGQRDAAIEHYHAALEIDPGYTKVYNDLGAVLVAEHQLDAAITNFYRAIHLDTNYAEAYNNLGNALSLQGKPAEAVTQFSEALRLNPTNAAFHLNSGLALLKLGQSEEAAARFADAIRLDPLSEEAHYELGRQFFFKGQLRRALEELSEAVKLKPEHAAAQFYLGLAYIGAGNEETGLNYLRQAARLRPDWAEPLNAQAWLLVTTRNNRLRDGTQAVQLAERAAQLTGNRQPVILHTLAVAYAETDRFDEAIRTAKEALELAQHSGQSNLIMTVQGALHSYETHQQFRP